MLDRGERLQMRVRSMLRGRYLGRSEMFKVSGWPA